MEYILEIDDVVSKEFCEDVISRFEQDQRKGPGETVNGLNEKIKKSTDLAISATSLRSDWQDVIDKVGECVNEVLVKYQEHVDAEGLDRGFSIHKTINGVTIGLPQIQKTERDGFYTWHHDSHLNRVFTYILYVNDVEEGIGGTTEFLCGKTIQPKAGKLVIFPATFTYTHRGTKLQERTKYIMTNFIYYQEPLLEHPRAPTPQVKENPTLISLESVTKKPENDDI